MLRHAPCSGDSFASRQKVVQSWGASISSYWGYSSNLDIEKALLDVIQLGQVTLNTDITPLLSSGNKSSEALYLDVIKPPWAQAGTWA